jgi:hypothetical protein
MRISYEPITIDLGAHPRYYYHILTAHSSGSYRRRHYCDAHSWKSMGMCIFPVVRV